MSQLAVMANPTELRHIIGIMAFFFFLMMNSKIFLSVKAISQEDLDNMAANMELRYDVLNNLEPTPDKSSPTFLAQITLKNKGKSPIRRGNWAVYFCSIRMIEPKHLAHNPKGYVLPGEYGIKFTHINGCLHKFETTSEFKDIVPGQAFRFKFKADYFSVARTDVMPRWYIFANGLSPMVLASTADEDLAFVGKFDSKEKWKRFADDVYNPYTPEKRFDINDVISDLGNGPYKLVPTPVNMKIDESKAVKITTEWFVYITPVLQNEAALLNEKMGLTVSISLTRQTKFIQLTTGDVSLPGRSTQRFPSAHESYSLEVDPSEEVVIITGQGPTGVFYGIQTLLGLMDSQNTVPKVSITDAPRYLYRGMHLDVARNFVPKADVLKLLDVMAMYKLNKFHFHLSDDEGWRLEIPGLPELTEVGGKRCFDLEEEKCILSQLGSGPGTTTTGTGYYTVREYKDILRYASKRHVQVIPEFDMPGHGHAAIKAMLRRHDKLASEGNIEEAKRFLLSEGNDTSRFLSVQYFSDVINPCIESTYSFIQHLVESLVNMHNDTQPLTTYHFGGDEVAHGAWTNSTSCKQLARELGSNFYSIDMEDQLKEYFAQRVANITANYSLELASWEDGLMDGNNDAFDRRSLRNSRVYGYTWNNVWEWGAGKRAYELANAGYQVVMCQATHLYFDHPQEPDPEERGFYWATRFTDTHKVFCFMPDDLFENVETKVSGVPLSRAELCKKEGMCTKLEKKENIVGMAGQLWTETVRSVEEMNSMIFPRMIALAERAWHKAPWEDITDNDERDRERTKDWEKFANTLGYKELARLDGMGVAYHVPPPGARIHNEKLNTRVAIPGLKIQYYKDGMWKDIEQNMKARANMTLRTRSADGLRFSRLIEVVGTSDTTSKAAGLPHLVTSSIAPCSYVMLVLSLPWSGLFPFLWTVFFYYV